MEPLTGFRFLFGDTGNPVTGCEVTVVNLGAYFREFNFHKFEPLETTPDHNLRAYPTRGGVVPDREQFLMVLPIV